MAEWVFAISAIVVLYTWVGYPALLALWAALRGDRRRQPDHAKRPPTVTLLIAAYNEEATIGAKLRNCLAQDYPGVLEVVVGCDGCTDGTEAIVTSFGPPVRLAHYARRRGKVAVINDTLPTCRGEIVVLTDAEELFDPQAVAHLVAAFTPGVGAVSGAVHFRHQDAAVGTGSRVYWRLEQYTRTQESRVYSMLGAAGCIYAVRRELFRPVPTDSISDDAVIPLDLVARGWRVVHAPAAIAYGERPGDAGREFRRKVRTTAGTWQFLWRQRRLLMPGSPVAVQMFSHYLLRHLCPVFMVTALLSAAAGAWQSGWLAVALVGQLAFYAAAVLGRCCGKRLGLRGILLPYYLCLAYVADVVGLFNLVTGRQSVAWQRN